MGDAATPCVTCGKHVLAHFRFSVSSMLRVVSINRMYIKNRQHEDALPGMVDDMTSSLLAVAF